MMQYIYLQKYQRGWLGYHLNTTIEL